MIKKFYPILWIVLVQFSTQILWAQSNGEPILNRNFNIYDRFGTEYSHEQLLAEQERIINNSCQAGYFDVVFQYYNEGLTEYEEEVICQVFQDLSNFIIPVSEDIPQLKYRVTDQETTYKGTASSYYITSNYEAEILDPVTWHLINTGNSPYEFINEYGIDILIILLH